MRKRIEPTLVENAIQTVPGFEMVFNKLEQQVTLRGQSKSTFNNYIRRIATISLHFGQLPERICDDEITLVPTQSCLHGAVNLFVMIIHITLSSKSNIMYT